MIPRGGIQSVICESITETAQESIKKTKKAPKIHYMPNRNDLV